MRIILVGLCALTLVSSSTHAQGIPRTALSIAYGSGASSSHAGELWFKEASGTITNAELDIRVGSPGSTRPVVTFGYDAAISDAQGSVKIISHLAVVGKFTYVDFPMGNARAWFRPLTFGARLSW